MSGFDAMIAASCAVWNRAEGDMLAAAGINKETSPGELQRLMATAQLSTALASTVEQKVSSAIDKAYQAHSQVSSK
jgi:hypothetical protein